VFSQATIQLLLAQLLIRGTLFQILSRRVDLTKLDGVFDTICRGYQVELESVAGGDDGHEVREVSVDNRVVQGQAIGGIGVWCVRWVGGILEGTIHTNESILNLCVL